MNFKLSKEIEMLQKAVRELANKKIAPNANEWDLRVQVNKQVLGCAYTIFNYGSEDLKQKYVPKLCSAEYIGGFGITEPDAGSDVMAMASTAEDKGDHWLMNGSKTWISNPNVADVLIYYADPDRFQRSRRNFAPLAGNIFKLQ